MELHTKQLQIGMNSAVTLGPSRSAHRVISMVISTKRICKSFAVLALFSCRCNLAIARILNWRTVVMQ